MVILLLVQFKFKLSFSSKATWHDSQGFCWTIILSCVVSRVVIMSANISNVQLTFFTKSNYCIAVS